MKNQVYNVLKCYIARDLTSSRSTQFVPLPVYPTGQLPHVKKGGSLHGKHCTPIYSLYIF